MSANPTLSLAVVGAGPVGLALALHAARALPDARVTVFDARPAEQDVSGDPRILALSLGSVQLLQRIDAWDAAAAQRILEVHVSQQPPTLPAVLASVMPEPEVRIRAIEEAVPMLGAVMSYGAVVAPLQRAWQDAVAREPGRLVARFGTPVRGVKAQAHGVELDAGIAESFDLAVVAEGGVFSDQVRKAVTHDYRQTAWVGTVALAQPRPGVAYERFTRHGPAALLPLKDGRAGLVWCVDRDDDPVAALDEAQRLAVLNTVFHAEVGPLVQMSPLKAFALGLNAERSLTQGRTVRIGNAAQTLHPVAGQGLNLGLRDAFELVRALSKSKDVDAVLRRLEWRRGPDRWTMIAATDFLASSFTWHLPGAGAARGLGIAAVQLLKPVKSA
ncbi:MAG TPA: FAD-dependent monooxygenase, partial [Albitalea sp.]|nr:FAD-dependent monooxygenase [Albitalea sp.]